MSNPKPKKEFRGLTVFELSLILLVIGSVFYWAFANKRSLQNNIDDANRKARVIAAKESLKGYILQNDSFPSTEDFLDDKKRSDIFASLINDEGEDALKDPKDKDTLLDYIAEPEGCAPGTDNLCTRASIGLVLSNGDDFVRFAIKPGTELEQLQTLNEEQQQSDQPASEEEQQLLKELESLSE
jgi:competence protein ComGC